MSPSLHPERTTLWIAGRPLEEIKRQDVAHHFAAGDGLIWFEWSAPRRKAEDMPYDHAALVEALADLDLEGAAGEDAKYVSPGITALRSPEAWVGPRGLTSPGIHARDGVVTATAVEMPASQLLRLGGVECGLLVHRISFVVLPRCLVSIRWRPDLDLTPDPPDEVLQKIRTEWREELSRFSHKNLADRVQATWRAESRVRESGDLAILAITDMTRSFAGACHQLSERLHDAELRLVTQTLSAPPELQEDLTQDGHVSRSDVKVGQLLTSPAGWRRIDQEVKAYRKTDDPPPTVGEEAGRGGPLARRTSSLADSRQRFGEVANSIAAFRKSVRPLRAYAGPLAFVADGDQLKKLQAQYDKALDQLERLRVDLRASLAAVGSAGAAIQLEIAQLQQEVAQRQQHRSRLQEARTTRIQRDIGILVVLPAISLPV